jgi:hypothetical protein
LKKKETNKKDKDNGEANKSTATTTKVNGAGKKK